MPCRYEPTPEEIEASRQASIEKQTKPLIKKLDALTHENDQLREIVLTSLATGKMVELTDTVAKKIHKDQVTHREEDLRRLNDYFREEMWKLIQKNGKDALTSPEMKELSAKIQRVQDADSEKPLEPQLGFDPDEY